MKEEEEEDTCALAPDKMVGRRGNGKGKGEREKSFIISPEGK